MEGMNFIKIANAFEQLFYENDIRPVPTVKLVFTDRDAYTKAEIVLIHELQSLLYPCDNFPSIAGGVTISGVHIVLELKEPVRTPDWRSSCATGEELG